MDYPSARLDIILVDNNSKDGSVKFVKSRFPKVKIIKNNINNYCASNNLGIKAAKGEYIALLNNDTEVDRGWLKELLNVMRKNKRIGALSSKILFMDGKIQSTGHQEYPNFYWGDRGFREKDKGQYNRVEETLSICGGAVLYRKECLDKVGLLDEDFIMYMDDVDMAIRCKKKGWKLFYVPKAIIHHVHNGTATKDLVTYYIERNRLLLVAKHYPKSLAKVFFGRGYFTRENFKKLEKVLPFVISKLTEHKTADLVKRSLMQLFKEIDKLLNYEKDLFVKDVDNAKQTIKAIDKKIKDRLNEKEF